MADSFDAYHKWLGISPKEQPPHHYRLLGIELFESDPDVIEGAADQRMSHVRTFQTGQNFALSQRILNELSAARLCLLTPQKKAEYDRQLREKLHQQSAAVSPVSAVPSGVPPVPAGPHVGASGQGEVHTHLLAHPSGPAPVAQPLPAAPRPRGRSPRPCRPRRRR
jgi:hypothetical protein